MSGNDFSDGKVRKANKDHVCDVCDQSIQKGTFYQDLWGIYYGHWFENRYHRGCNNLLVMVHEKYDESVLEGNNPDELVMDELTEVTLEEVIAACEGLDSQEIERACGMWRQRNPHLETP